MRRRSLRFAGGLFVAGAVACKAYSSDVPADGLPPDAGSDGASLNATADAGSETDGGADSGGTPDLLNETFESSCAGWTLYGGATLVWQAGVGRNGSAGCVFTASKLGYVIKGVGASEPG